MIFHALLVILSQLPVAQGSFVWECPEPLPVVDPAGGTAGYTASGCGLSGSDGSVLLPSKSIFLPGGAPSWSVTAEGVYELPSDGLHVSTQLVSGAYEPASTADLPGEWGSFRGDLTFRRARLARIELHPVICRGDRLFAARRIVVRPDMPEGGARMITGSTPTGAEARLFELLCGSQASSVVAGRARDRADSPFWGLPWFRISVDTAGVFALSCEDLPGVEGAPSASLALFCGRGMMMGDSPWEDSYVPRPVPVWLEDGGDGTFDMGDSLFFFARGLSWWVPDGSATPPHFTHEYSAENCYWLTWGGESGARMQVIDAGLTGVPAMPSAFTARNHFEYNYIREFMILPDNWAWDASYGSGSQQFFHAFTCAGATGEGVIRLNLRSPVAGRHGIQVMLNDVTLCDTAWEGSALFRLDVGCSNLADPTNMLSIRLTHNPAMDDIFFDWFEVFAQTAPVTSGQTQVPLEWYASAPSRFRVDWQSSLTGCRIFAISGDTASALLATGDPSSFEVELPSSWEARELWIVPPGGYRHPLSVAAASPGRILGVLDGAETVYAAAGSFVDDASPLAAGSPSAELIDVQEIYDEFNGGVRDPGAIRAFVDEAVNTWDPAPLDLVLVGGGHFDPRNNISSIPCYIDVLFYPSFEICGDDLFGIVSGAAVPQVAVSRIAARQGTEVQRVAERSLEYASGEAAGQWQSLVIGAADDERSSKYAADEQYHTVDMEYLLESHLPDFIRPVKHYLIFYGWDEYWKKPEARADFIDLWTEGALAVLYLGHGGFDQLADEGLLYIEDMSLLACGPRLPVAFFGSCSVGQFQDPNKDCIAQSVTTSPAGGAIVSIGATDETIGAANTPLVAGFLDALFSQGDLSASWCLLAAKLANGFTDNDKRYEVFGNGSLRIAVPPSDMTLSSSGLRTGEQASCEGLAPGEGLVMLQAFESCTADTYYTFRQNLPIPYVGQGSRFYNGCAQSDPDLDFDIFVPVDADTGSTARISAFLLGPGGASAGVLYPEPLVPGTPSPTDTAGPVISLWLDGFRSAAAPSVSGPVIACAELSDPSGINLLGNPGRQLALYLDGSPQDVSPLFRYDAGSTTQGSLEAALGSLSEGAHTLELRASDGLLNRSSVAMSFTVLSTSGLTIWQAFPYPCPSSGGLSLNWMQSGEGSVDIEIFTVNGLRILRERNIPAEAGYNSWWWDGADADGDPVASGSYIYRIRASSGAGADECTGVLAIVRES